jgi:hypothetical protein
MATIIELRTRKRPAGPDPRTIARTPAEVIIFPRMTVDDLRRVAEATQPTAAPQMPVPRTI